MASFLPTFKSRKEPNGPERAVRVQVLVNGPYTYRRYQGFTQEEIISQCHSGTWPPPYGSETDVGGPMQLHRTWTSYPVTSPVSIQSNLGQTGLATMTGYVFGGFPATLASISDLNVFGTSAIAHTAPTNPNASLATALGELRQEGLPRLPGSSMRDQVDLARRSGNEFLNVEFGWLPLVNDLRAFADSVKRSRQLIEQYRRDSDHKIRRRFSPQTVYQTPVLTTGTGNCYGLNIFALNSTVSRSASERFWFSGAFKYHVPVGDDFMNRLSRYESYANYLFGTRITPEVVWNLAPWSWAIDWFTNASDVIHNISILGRDGLVLQYGYAMRHMVVEELHEGTWSLTQAGVTQTGRCVTSRGSEYKQRIRANPYGFGVDDTSLSAIQLAILAALGLTRGQRDN